MPKGDVEGDKHYTEVKRETRWVLSFTNRIFIYLTNAW